MLNSRKRVRYSVVVTLILGLGLSWQFSKLDAERQQSEARARVVSELAAIRARTEGVFKATFSATESMVHLISAQGGITHELFNSLASQLVAEHPTIRNMVVAPDDVVTMVYPLKGNEATLGFHYKTVPEQWHTVEKARLARRPLLAGPVALVQGGTGVIIRTPVFLTANRDEYGLPRYWGTQSTVVLIDRLLGETGITRPQSLELALRGKDAMGAEGDPIYGRSELFLEDPVVMDVDVPGGRWQLAGAPQGGWPQHLLLNSPYFLFGCINSLLLAGIIGMLVHRRESVRARNTELVREVEDRRQAEQALSESEARFRQMFVSSPDPAWLIEDGRFTSCNSTAAAVLGLASASELLGRSLLECSPPEQADGETSAARLQRMMGLARLQGTHRFEWAFHHQSGHIFPAELTLSAITLQGRPCLYCVWRDISAFKRTQAELERMAHYDALTGLPNRTLLLDRLTRAIDWAERRDQQVALLLLDLDGFKTVNDSLGHPVGDALLAQVAERLKASIRIEDTVGRLGGDEFALVLGDLEDGTDVVEVVRKILTVVEVPFEVDGHAALVTASIGIAVYPLDGVDRNELIRNADAAMYGAKEAGRNTYRFYQARMTREAQGRLYLEQALRRALQQNELEVWYQPQIRLSDGACVGAEALVRWRDPDKGMISPAEFIPLAERTGLIVPLGEYVIEEVCQAIRQWRHSGLDCGCVSVNVAGAQITRSDFVKTVSGCLARYALPAEVLAIEVTETLLMEHMEHAIEVLDDIKALGMKTAIDDFGTGYSSLAYLKRLPIDTLKIDRAFVQDIEDDPYDQAINRTIVAMGHSLEFTVIAEGVESEAQLSFLRAEGCDEGQGYLFSRPLPMEGFTAWLKARSDMTEKLSG